MRVVKHICLILFLFPALSFARGDLLGYCTQGGQVIQTNAIPSSTKVMQSYPQCSISVFYNGGPSGHVTTSGTAVTWTDGTLFNANSGWPGLQITINSVSYTILSVASQTSLTLTSSAGVQAVPVAYSMPSTSPAAIYDSTGTAKTNPFASSLAGLWQFYADNGQYDIRLSGGGIPAPFTWSNQDLIDPLSLPDTFSDGTVTTGAQLITLCTRAGLLHRTLVVSYNQNWDVNGTLNCSIQANTGGGFCPATGHTTTFGGTVDGTIDQHFSSSCGGSFAAGPSFSIKAMYPQNWPIIASASTDQTIGLQAAIDGMTNMGVHAMTFPPNGDTYAFTHLQLPSDTKLDCGPGLPGADNLVKATLKGLGATSMIGYGMQAVTNVNHATVTWVSGDKFDKTVLTSAGNSIVFAGIPTFHAYNVVSVDSSTQLTIDIGSHDPGVQPNQLTNMRVDGNAVIGCQINGNNVATAGIIMYDGGVFPQIRDNYFTSFPFASSNAAIKGGAVLYADFIHNGVSTASRGLDIISAYSSSNSGQPCGFCNIQRNDFFTAGVRYNGLAINFEGNDLEGESAEAPWANIDLSQGDCEACSVTGTYTEDPCSVGAHTCNWIYGTVAGPIAIEHNTVFGNRSGAGNKTLAFNIIGQANGIRDNYVTGWDYDFGIVAANNNNIYLDESNSLFYAVSQIEYSTAGGFIPPYEEDGSGTANLNQMHLVDDANGLIGRMSNGLTCIFPNVVMRLGCGNIFRLDQAGTFTGATYPNTTTPRTGQFFMYSNVASILATHGGVNTTGLFNFSAQHSFTLPNHYPLNMMVETTGTISEVKNSQDIPTTYAVMNAITCNSTNEGVHFPITNSNTSTFGATISGAGANHGIAWCDGTNWTFR